MGRKKLAMKLIKGEKPRNSTFEKKSKAVFKKARELSILCSVPVCVIMYYHDVKQGKKQQQQAQVYSFKGNDESIPSPNEMHMFAREMVERYLRVPIEERNKKSVTLGDVLDMSAIRADEQDRVELPNSKMGNNKNIDSSFLDRFSHDQLVELVGRLDQKIEYVRQRIDVIKGGGTNYNNNNNHNDQGAVIGPDLGQYLLEPPTAPMPLSSVMSSGEGEDNNNAPNQMGYFGQLNQFPQWINNYYPMISPNNQECFGQLGPYNNHQQQYGCALLYDQIGATTKLEKNYDISNGTTSSSSNNMLMYNNNMMMGNGVGPFYYDQRSGITDNMGASSSSSSYGGGLPMQYPRLQANNNNAPLPFRFYWQ